MFSKKLIWYCCVLGSLRERGRRTRKLAVKVFMTGSVGLRLHGVRMQDLCEGAEEMLQVTAIGKCLVWGDLK